jgi:hypothetical protein
MTTKIEPDAGLALRRAIAWSRRWKWLGAIGVAGCLAAAIGIGSWVAGATRWKSQVIATGTPATARVIEAHRSTGAKGDENRLVLEMVGTPPYRVAMTPASMEPYEAGAVIDVWFEPDHPMHVRTRTDATTAEDTTATGGYLGIFGLLIIVVVRLRSAVLVGRAFAGAHRADRVRAIGVASIGKGRLYVVEANGRFAGTRRLFWFGIAPGAPAWLFLTSTSCAFVRLHGHPRYMRQIRSPDSLAPLGETAQVRWRDAETSADLEHLPDTFP